MQGSLFDTPVPHGSWATGGGPRRAAEPRPLAGSVVRTELGDGAWVDVRPDWLSGCDGLFECLRDDVPWRAERRPMYDRVVDVPRLLCFYDEDATLPHPMLDAAKADLDAYYAEELGESFATAGLCLYRDGRDSVAWHGDRIGRSSTEDTLVAIVSLGDTRDLWLRPRPDVAHEPGGRRAKVKVHLAHGDLIVMGGSTQRTWEHCVPKVKHRIGPRLSVQFRPHGVR